MIPVAPDTLSTLLICSLHYALGRHSYITGQIAGIVREHYGKLNASDREVAIRDVEKHIKQDDRRRGDVIGVGPGAIDHECDRREWASLLAWMKATKETAR